MTTFRTKMSGHKKTLNKPKHIKVHIKNTSIRYFVEKF